MAPQPHEMIWSLATAAIAGRCLHVVADLHVADLIGDHPAPVTELAASCGADADALDRVLRLLAAHGVFERVGDGYGHTPASRLLREDDPVSMGSFAQMMGLPLFWGSLTELPHSVRTSRPAVEKLAPEGLWPYLAARPDEAAVFGRAMTAKAAAEIAAVLAVYDFSRYDTIADVGGGRGHLLRAALDSAPNATGFLFDLPHVIDAVDINLQRITPVAGDFFTDDLPAADVYVLMEVLHDWADDQCVEILTAIHRSASDDATLLVIEGVLPEEHLDPRAQTLDVLMLAATGGRERTADELATLFGRAGFQLVHVLDTASPMRIVEACRR